MRDFNFGEKRDRRVLKEITARELIMCLHKGPGLCYNRMEINNVARRNTGASLLIISARLIY